MSEIERFATVIVSRAIRAGQEQCFEQWADRFAASARDADGYLSTLRLGQTEGLQHLVFRFRDASQAKAWRASDGFARLGAEADAFSVGLDQLHQGDPARFELPSDASAAKWKRFVTTWAAVFPVLLVISSAMRWLLKGQPPIVQLIPSSLLLTAGLQWLILPRHSSAGAVSGC